MSISLLEGDGKFLLCCGKVCQVESESTTPLYRSHYYDVHFTDKETKTLKEKPTSKITWIKSEKIEILNPDHPDPSIYALNISFTVSTYIR